MSGFSMIEGKKNKTRKRIKREEVRPDISLEFGRDRQRRPENSRMLKMTRRIIIFRRSIAIRSVEYFTAKGVSPEVWCV